MMSTIRNVINLLVAIALVLAPVSSVLASKVHQCDESAMSVMSMDMQSALADSSMPQHTTCKCKHAQNQKCCSDDVCKCLTSLHVFIGINPGRVNFDNLPPVYNKLVAVMETDLFIHPLLRPPIA